ncbi:endolytic transglycosylase MltG [Fundicoccus sp. Sow4_F4]|uniref:endolytic transglycosylase MltG n=1 Tax=Fundicoccus sp. Sow4_F4 TaxID=3438783 RepID=UPI003F8E049D
MASFDWKTIREQAKSKETYQVKEKMWTNRIVKIIIITILTIMIAGGLGGYFYVRHTLSSVDSSNDETVEVTVPIGSSTKDIASILKDKNIIHNDYIFDIYLRLQNVGDLQAGHFEFNQSMDAGDIVATLQKGGEPIFEDIDTTITVIEGTNLEEISELIEDKTPFTAEEFMELVNDEAYIASLSQQFPTLLGDLTEVEGLRYPLEGYLFPATYDYIGGMTLEDLVTQMVSTMNLEFQAIREDLDQTWMTFHQVLTLASIVEREGITDEDRAMIAGVFLNRIEVGMPLQSDITILYALGEHKELVTLTDLEVESPYNLYMYTGLAPGPYNSPSMSSIMATIYPTYTDYYYFVADLDTQEIYYSTNIDDHNALVEQYVNPYFEEDEEAVDEEATGEDVEEVTEEIIGEDVE